MVQSLPSNVPGANEGLFAKVKIKPNTTLAFYNGKRIKPKSKEIPPLKKTMKPFVGLRLLLKAGCRWDENCTIGVENLLFEVIL